MSGCPAGHSPSGRCPAAAGAAALLLLGALAGCTGGVPGEPGAVGLRVGSSR